MRNGVESDLIFLDCYIGIVGMRVNNGEVVFQFPGMLVDATVEYTGSSLVICSNSLNTVSMVPLSLPPATSPPPAHTVSPPNDTHSPDAPTALPTAPPIPQITMSSEVPPVVVDRIFSLGSSVKKVIVIPPSNIVFYTEINGTVGSLHGLLPDGSEKWVQRFELSATMQFVDLTVDVVDSQTIYIAFTDAIYDVNWKGETNLMHALSSQLLRMIPLGDGVIAVFLRDSTGVLTRHADMYRPYGLHNFSASGSSALFSKRNNTATVLLYPNDPAEVSPHFSIISFNISAYVGPWKDGPSSKGVDLITAPSNEFNFFALHDKKNNFIIVYDADGQKQCSRDINNTSVEAYWDPTIETAFLLLKRSDKEIDVVEFATCKLVNSPAVSGASSVRFSSSGRVFFVVNQSVLVFYHLSNVSRLYTVEMPWAIKLDSIAEAPSLTGSRFGINDVDALLLNDNIVTLNYTSRSVTTMTAPRDLDSPDVPITLMRVANMDRLGASLLIVRRNITLVLSLESKHRMRFVSSSHSVLYLRLPAVRGSLQRTTVVSNGAVVRMNLTAPGSSSSNKYYYTAAAGLAHPLSVQNAFAVDGFSVTLCSEQMPYDRDWHSDRLIIHTDSGKALPVLSLRNLCGTNVQADVLDGVVPLNSTTLLISSNAACLVRLVLDKATSSASLATTRLNYTLTIAATVSPKKSLLWMSTRTCLPSIAAPWKCCGGKMLATSYQLTSRACSSSLPRLGRRNAS